MHREGNQRAEASLQEQWKIPLLQFIINGALFFPAEILLIPESLAIPDSLQLWYKIGKQGLSAMACQFCIGHLPNSWNEASSTVSMLHPPPSQFPDPGFYDPLSFKPSCAVQDRPGDQWSPTRAGLLSHCEPEDEASPRSKIPLLRDSCVQKAVVALMSAKWSEARCEERGLHRRAPCHPEQHCRQLSSQAHTVVPSPPASYFHPTVASKWVDKSHNFSPRLVPSIGKSKNTTLGDPPGQKCFTCWWAVGIYWFSHLGVKM